MFARFLTPYEAEAAERERVRKRAPHLALVPHEPTPPKPAEPDHFAWRDVADLFGGSAERVPAMQLRDEH